MKQKDKQKEELIERAVWIHCAVCGTEYLESKAYILMDDTAECPICGSKLGIGTNGEEF